MQTCSRFSPKAAGWTRRTTAVLLMGAACVLVGCSTREKVTYEPVNRKPIVGDEAMALRADWPRAVSHYQNGSVAAFSTRYPYETNASVPETDNLFLEPVLFFGQVILLPAELVANPPGQVQVWHGVVYPPTYTAQPPLPPPGGARTSGPGYVGPAAMPNARNAGY